MLTVYIYVLNLFSFYAFRGFYDWLSLRRGDIKLEGNRVLSLPHIPNFFILKIAFSDSQVVKNNRFDILICKASEYFRFIIDIDDRSGFLEAEVRTFEFPFIQHRHHAAVIEFE